MGLLDFLSPALTVGAQAAGAYQGAQSQAAQQKAQNVIQQLVWQRQAQQFALEQALNKAKIGQVNAEAYRDTRAGDKLQEGDPGYIDYQTQLEGAKAKAIADAKLPDDIALAVKRGEIDLANGKQLAAQRGNIEAGLQKAHDTFEGVQGNLNRTSQQGIASANRTAEGNRQQTGIAGALANKTAETRQVQSGQIFPQLESLVGAGPLAHGAARVTGAAATPASTMSPSDPSSPFRSAVQAPRATPSTPPTIPASAISHENAALWDAYVQQGLPPAEATAQVLGTR